MEALVEEAPRPMIGGLEMGRRHSCFVWFARLFAHYPQLLDIVQVMVRPSWHAICALAMVAVLCQRWNLKRIPRTSPGKMEAMVLTVYMRCR